MAAFEVRLEYSDPSYLKRKALSALTFLYIMKHQEAGQTIGEAAGYCLEKALLCQRPDPGVGTLMQSEHPRFIYLRVQGPRDKGFEVKRH